MRGERRKQLCELLQLIEEDLLIELLHSWRDKKAPEFWTGVDQLKGLEVHFLNSRGSSRVIPGTWSKCRPSAERIVRSPVLFIMAAWAQS